MVVVFARDFGWNTSWKQKRAHITYKFAYVASSRYICGETLKTQTVALLGAPRG